MLVHRDLFGDRIEGLTMCPQCQGPVEVRFDVTDFAQQSEAIVEPALVVVQDYEVHWRLPTCGDLAELADETSPERMRQRMLERCLLEIRRRDERIASAECPPAVIDNVCTAMAQADPWGDIRLEVTCPECGTKWKSAFDIGAFLWRELDAWARRLLREIHCLASAFGWSERDILALSARRRAMYLEMVGA
jgi:rubredoxin